MAAQKTRSLAAIATAIALIGVPTVGSPGSSQPLLINIAVQVRPSASFKLQNAADVGPSGFTGGTSDAPPLLVLNTPPVKPEVVVDVAADAAGPADARSSGDVAANAAGGDIGKQLSLKDLGVAAPPSVRRAEGSDLKETFERAAGEIMYRLDSLTKINGGRLSAPVVITINL